MRLSLTVCSILLAIFVIFSEEAFAQKQEAAAYTSAEGIRFVSYSSLWNEQKLKELYDSLLKCDHGEELSALKQVILDPAPSEGKSGSRVGNYNADTQVIRLFEVESTPVIRTLIHEYGHHFTYYWLRKKEGTSPRQLTESSTWSKVRQLNDYPIRWSGSTLPYLHKWDPGEIMAEDYVMLFGVGGSPLNPKSASVVNMLRHENEYIPSAQSQPALRQYWEQLAGLSTKEPIRLPEIKQWQALEDIEEGTNRLVFTSAATQNYQLIQYGIHVTSFREGQLINWTTAINTMGKEPVEVKLDMNALRDKDSMEAFNGIIQIWALDPQSNQLVYTPFYMNWFTFEPSSRTLQAIPPSFSGRGLTAILKRDGLDKWPLTHLIMNGMPLTPIKRYEDKEGNVYVPLRLFNEETVQGLKEQRTVDSDGGRRIKVKYKQRDIQLRLDEQQAIVNGVTFKLSQRVRRMGSEFVVGTDDLKTLFNVTARWDESGSSLLMESI
ncbi:Copper amine oxidase N-terminal domain-containing protein [Paenibacillus sp. 1_12]|uniref:stalk domain-containing protein n=1 Tax=Paenibacillus sp. 1_12 TaxID=1566278 RepID=UPI0008E84FF8|nr:stalk domain-containing protein [Paenibacillus sp. 1_12]SFL49226.1 Copper amine oxidase N-terminal domain-containing protein [Paenibacillus sp. 1_12]